MFYKIGKFEEAKSLWQKVILEANTKPFDFQEKLPEEIERIRKLLEENNVRKSALDLINEELTRSSSPLRATLIINLYLADLRRDQGNLIESKRLYEEVVKLGQSACEQAEEYVRGCFNHQKKLQEYNKKALMFYKIGKFEEAKSLWQKVILEANTKPFIIHF
jgi:tetratricopeptide (TPR) repeat protein